jgi:diacylglycerol kinase
MSFAYATRGVSLALSGRNMRIHLSIAIIVIAAGGMFRITTAEWLWVVACISAVAAAEVVNTALEKTCDLIDDIASLGIDTRIRNIKDLAAGAVLIIALASAMIGLIVFTPYIL